MIFDRIRDSWRWLVRSPRCDGPHECGWCGAAIEGEDIHRSIELDIEAIAPDGTRTRRHEYRHYDCAAHEFMW
jgi:hypothetical protein